ncbi:MAG: site-specific DNA-methyltransferase [Atopobiaceae bacterium]|nr:site-specific DNA-methyltransferase [Atopobiaceae bacterium]
MIEKIERRTPDLTDELVDKLAELMPDIVTEDLDAEGNVVRSVDFDTLRENLTGSVADGRRERYQFTWPGKAKARLEARTPTAKTMRPCPEKSVDWETTQNLYVEGDNLEALKIMRETYAGKVKLIYIDPPYNTGHDFIYDDDFAETHAEYAASSGEFDEEGGRLVANPESNGRFHSDWCSMMYPRLLLARDLLSPDGAIFISIDDGESKNLRAICDEVFGGTNFKSDISWQKRYTRSNNTVDFTTVVEHVLVYSRGDGFQVNLLPRTEGSDEGYTNPDNDPRGPWITASYVNPARKEQRPNLVYEIIAPDGRVVTHPTNAWKYSKSEYGRHASEHRLWWGLDGSAQYPRKKIYLSEARGMTPINLWKHEYAGNTDMGGNETKELMGKKYFDFPKPTLMMRRVLEHGSEKDSIVLDFFSGSGSMADAVMQQNAEDGGSRKFIMVQIPESCGEKSEAVMDGYETICDLGEERIRRAAAKVRAEIEESNRQLHLGEEPKPLPDLGFRVLRVGDSVLRDVHADPASTGQATLLDLIDNMEEGATPLDLLFQVLPKFRIPYSCAIEEREVDGRTVLDVNGGQLLACFDEDVSTATIEAIAKARPLYAVFRDASFSDDSAVANLEELFKTFSPDTIRRVI